MIEMDDLQASKWAQTAFGDAAADLATIVPGALRAAHKAALTAHISAEMTSNDTYGHTLKVKQYELLVEHVRDITGVTTRRPQGMRFELAVVPETNVAILPLRYTTDPKEKREDSRLPSPVSDLRKSLLGLNSSATPRQLTIEHAFEDDATLADNLEELEEIDKQLRKFGRIVVVGYASNPTVGVWGIGWGDLELEDESTGQIHWTHWESLIESRDLNLVRDIPLRAVEATPHTDVANRFDSGEDDDDFDLTPRSPSSEAPTSEPEREPKSTGVEENQ
ncbi:hypothetical protein ACRB8A_20195 (plasmid) [Arthrobacter sp. G.S.26]|uniref:hypothetical protein n=1 Tax=Arthrobacter sp. G.S.26 TaxID=3433706 RepID=UPI003D773311